MRRIAPTIGPALALVVAALPLSSVHASVSSSGDERVTTTARSSTGLDTASSALGTSFVRVSWNWIRAASGYRIQVSRTKDFGTVAVARKKRNSSYRPAGGREAAVVGSLKDATYYWVRVRKVKGHHKGPWSSPVRVATRAHRPDKMSHVRGVAGPAPGETTLHWRTDGGHTDLFRVTTALSPFGSRKTSATGRHSMTFKVPGDRRSLTLTAAQTAAAGAALGSGRHLFFRIVAVRKGEADTATRPYAHLRFTTVSGQAPTGTGPGLRIGQYNMHIYSRDVPGHPWRDRAPLIANNIARAHPAVMSLQELLPPMWTTQAGGPGLDKALNRAGVGYYRITRTTAFLKGAPGDSRILYDPNRVTPVTGCDLNVGSCGLIRLPDPLRPHFAAYAEFETTGSNPERFLFVSTHLSTGNDATTDALRGRQAEAIASWVDQNVPADLPVIIGGDFNSSQTSKGVDSPHTVMLQDGFYNASAAVTQVNMQFNSVNHYISPEKPSNYGFGSIIDTVMTRNMPGAAVFKQVRTGTPWPSDHNMIYTDVRLP